MHLCTTFCIQHLALAKFGSPAKGWPQKSKLMPGVALTENCSQRLYFPLGLSQSSLSSEFAVLIISALTKAILGPSLCDQMAHFYCLN